MREPLGIRQSLGKNRCSSNQGTSRHSVYGQICGQYRHHKRIVVDCNLQKYFPMHISPQTMNEVTAAQKREKKAQAEAQENAEERDRLEDKFIGE